MQLVERVILERLFSEAAREGFQCVRFACTPSTGYPGDAIEGDALIAAQCLKHAAEWDSHSVIEFADARGAGIRPTFWVLLVWGNGESLLSDYQATRDAERIVGRVSAWIDEG